MRVYITQTSHILCKMPLSHRISLVEGLGGDSLTSQYIGARETPRQGIETGIFPQSTFVNCPR